LSGLFTEESSSESVGGEKAPTKATEVEGYGIVSSDFFTY